MASAIADACSDHDAEKHQPRCLVWVCEQVSQAVQQICFKTSNVNAWIWCSHPSNYKGFRPSSANKMARNIEHVTPQMICKYFSYTFKSCKPEWAWFAAALDRLLPAPLCISSTPYTLLMLNFSLLPWCTAQMSMLWISFNCAYRGLCKDSLQTYMVVLCTSQLGVGGLHYCAFGSLTALWKLPACMLVLNTNYDCCSLVCWGLNQQGSWAFVAALSKQPGVH